MHIYFSRDDKCRMCIYDISSLPCSFRLINHFFELLIFLHFDRLNIYPWSVLQDGPLPRWHDDYEKVDGRTKSKCVPIRLLSIWVYRLKDFIIDITLRGITLCQNSEGEKWSENLISRSVDPHLLLWICAIIEACDEKCSNSATIFMFQWPIWNSDRVCTNYLSWLWS